MIRTILIKLILAISIANPRAGVIDKPVWPSPPADPKVEYVDEINCNELELKTGFLGKLKRYIGGQSEMEKISLPFDILATEDRLYLTCQNIPYLIEVEIETNSFKLYSDTDYPFVYPIALCHAGGGTILISDSEAATIFKFKNGRVKPFITENLLRPTGIAALYEREAIYVVDTGDHSLKIFDYMGKFIKKIGGQSNDSSGFNFPTFALANSGNAVFVNDALNYKIKRFDGDGNLEFSFGEEGNGPGTFSRPKGIAMDNENHVYVVDNIFDNVQVFDKAGKLLLVIGSGGQSPGQFWSPAGIDIVDNTIYIADTFNNRVQILRYLEGGKR
ncbi:MAG: hypothetical protein JSW64_10215 [Candidatus Zixiibacteriota bacterium]|nr:MAG: hypothetical protein JSW64_10215 [candidate division Zixibacteria bacterium]